MSSLLPCPFCGGEAVVYDCGDSDWAIRCVGECKTYHGQEWVTKDAAIAAWNRRAALASGDEVEQLKARLKEAEACIRDAAEACWLTGAYGAWKEKHAVAIERAGETKA